MNISFFVSPFAVGVASRIAVQIVAFLQIMIASRFLGLSDFGTYTLGWASCVIVVSFVYTGFYQALLRCTDFDGARHTGFWSMAAIGAGGALALAAVGLALLGSRSETAPVFLAFAPFPVIRALVAWNEVHLVRDRRVRLVSVYGVLSETAAVAVTWACLVHGVGLFSLVFGRYTAMVVELAIAFGAARSLPALQFSRSRFATLRTTAFPLWGTSALAMFSNYGADLMLGAFLNTAAVGAYRGASRVSQTASDLVFQPLNTLTWSRMSQLEKSGQQSALKEVWLGHMGFGALVLWPVLAAFAVLAKDLVLFLFDESWLPAAPVIVILSLSRALAFLSILLEPTLVCLDRGRVQLQVRAVAAAVSLVALLAFGRFGAEQAAAAHVLASAVTAALALSVFARSLRLTLAEIVRALLPAAVLSALCLSGLVLTGEMRAALGPTTGLLTAIAALALVWIGAAIHGLRSGRVALPRP